MAHINYLGGLSREFHHVKVGNDQDSKYEPCLVIINETAPRFKGQAFIVPLSCLWKYMEPWWTMSADRIDLEEIMNVTWQLALEGRFGKTKEFIRKQAALLFAEALHQNSKILRMTGFNLAMCMQMFEIAPNPQAASQLLMFIQDGLDELRNMPLHIPETEWQIGEARLSDGGVPIGSQPVTLTESDLLAD